VVAVGVGTQVLRKVDRKAGLRTIVGVVEDSNPPVLVVDLWSLNQVSNIKTSEDVNNLGVGSIVVADRRSNPCWPYFNRRQPVN
jgi:hypothetical protein